MLGRGFAGLGMLAASAVLLWAAPLARAAEGPLDVQVVQTTAGLGQRMARRPDLHLTARQPATCKSSQLRLSVASASSRRGSFAQVVVIVDASDAACSLRGYPALSLLDGERPLRVAEHDGGGALFDDHGSETIELGPGVSASFAFGGRRTRACRRANRVSVTLPGIGSPLSTSLSAPACRAGIVVSAVGLGPDSVAFGPSPAMIGVKPAIRYQRIVGVGAAMTDSSAWLIYDELPAAPRERLIDRLFGASGIHLAFTLVPMGASDFTSNGVPYTYDDMPSGKSDPTLAHFSITHDQAYVLPALRQVLAADPGEQILAVPWTAPAWMKANHALDDSGYQGTLRPADYGPFAEYFVKFLQDYAAAGVPVSAIAPENEPLSPASFPAMNFPEPTEAQWIADYLQPALGRARLNPQIFGGDGPWTDPSYAKSLAQSPAGADLAGIAWHCYGGVPSAMDALHAIAPSLEQIATECSPGISPYNAAELEIGAFRNGASIATLWNLALDPAGGPVEAPNSGCGGCTGVVTIAPSDGQVTYSRDYYQLGQLSAFVAPGAQRIGCPDFSRYTQSAGGIVKAGRGLADVAFRNPGGSIVLLAYNSSTHALGFTVRWAGRSFQYALAAGATVTLKWKPA